MTQPSEPPVAPPVAPLPLPETRRSRRAGQRRRRQQQRRRRRLAVVAAAVALVAAAGLVAAGRPGGGGGEASRAGPARAQPVAAVPPVLLAQSDESGRAVSITVLVPAAGAKGGSLVLVPPGTMAEVVSLGLEPVGRSLDLGGASRLQATVENLLGAPIGAVHVADDNAVAALVQPAGPLTVRVPQRVEDVDAGGRVQVLFEPGPTKVEPGEAGRFLATKGRGTDLERLARHQAFWDAWLAALRERPAAAPASPEPVARAFKALVGGPVRTRVVPVESFGSSPADGELYKVRAAELRRMVASTFPGADRSAAAARPRVQILNGTGTVGLADSVRAKLGAGFDVRLTGNAARFDYADTQIVFYDRAEQAMAERVRRALGMGTLVFSRRPLDVVDVTIVVGKDFRPE